MDHEICYTYLLYIQPLYVLSIYYTGSKSLIFYLYKVTGYINNYQCSMQMQALSVIEGNSSLFVGVYVFLEWVSSVLTTCKVVFK